MHKGGFIMREAKKDPDDVCRKEMRRERHKGSNHGLRRCLTGRWAYPGQRVLIKLEI